MEKLLERILSELQGVKTEQNQINKRLDGFEQRFDRMENRLMNLEQGQQEMNTKIDRLEISVQMTFRATLETHQAVKAMLDAQARQAVAIEKIKKLEH